MSTEKSEEALNKNRSSFVLLTVSLVLSLVSMTVVVVLTSPVSGGPVTIFFFLSLLLLFIFSLVLLVFRFLPQRVRNVSISSSSYYYIAFSVALGAIFLVGLQTLQQLRLIDIILVLIFEVLINFYLARRF